MVQCTSYKEGILAPGNGPSFAERKRRQHARQLQKAKRIGKEMFEDSENGHVIDPSSSYQPPRNKKRIGKQSGGNQSKGKVTVNSGPVAYGDTPNMTPTNMPLSNVSPQNVPSSFMSPQNALPSFSSTPNTFPSSLPLHNAPESNVPQAYVPPSNVPPPISVPPNNSGPYWQQAFQSTFPCFTHWPISPAVNAPQSNPYPPSSNGSESLTVATSGIPACLLIHMRLFCYPPTFKNATVAEQHLPRSPGVLLITFALNMWIRG